MAMIKIDHGVPKPPSRQQREDDDDIQVLRVITEHPRMTQRAIAKELGWIRTTGVAKGAPNSHRVGHAIRRLLRKGRLR